MGAIGGMLGLNGGVSGTGMPAPSGIPLLQGTDPTQINSAYAGAQSSLRSQQALLEALQAQNGIGNQSQVYGQLQGVVNGTGPNPAQAMLNQATGQNVANQAALMAGQRGASANAGLMARQAAQQGAGIQQNAVGQAATLQANQALGALGAAGNMANQQVANQIGATTANTQAHQSEQQILQNALAQQNNANVNMQGNLNNTNTQLADRGMQGQQGMIGGLLGGLGSAIGMAEGGVTPEGPQSSFGRFLQGWAGSGTSAPISGASIPMVQASPGAQSLQNGMSGFVQGVGKAMKGSGSVEGYSMPEFGGQFSTPAPTLGMNTNLSGPAVAAPAPAYSLGVSTAFARGGNVGSQLKSGGNVPGTAQVAGNSTRNDTVKALLSPGELVVDRETMKDPGPMGQTARLLAAAIEAKKRGKK